MRERVKEACKDLLNVDVSPFLFSPSSLSLVRFWDVC